MEKYYPKEFKEYKDLELDLDDAIVNSGYYEAASKDKRIHHDGGGHEHIMIQTTDFEIKRHMDMNFGADVIVSNERYNMIKYGQIKGSRSFIVYANDKTDEIIAYMKKMGEPYKKYFKVNAEVTYYKQLKEYNRRALSDVNFATFITIGIFIISLIMIYFMIKSNAVARSEELTVYRLIGISRFSILKTYMLEITILTLYVCIPTILVTTIVIKFVSSIPSLQLSLTFPWWTSLALMASLLLINNIISIMPVYGIISKPPAKLAIKE
jgi:ABC-type antimicrobial peptide transport system permease subunit